MSTLGRKARGDLRRHPARTVLTIATLALAIGSLAIAAVPALMNRVMADQVAQAKLFDITMATNDLALTPVQLAGLSQLPDIAAVEPEIQYSTQATSGGTTADAAVWGLDFASQPIDVVGLSAGHLPAPGELLSDDENASAGGLPVAVGSRVSLRTTTGANAAFPVSGEAHGLYTSPKSAPTGNSAVFYASIATVRSLAGVHGYNFLAFRLRSDSPAAQQAAVTAVTGYLEAQVGTNPLTYLPATRNPSDWPGRSSFDAIMNLFLVITVLAMLCAVFLIANTMNTLVVEQSAEIAILKTLGGRRRQIAGVILRSAALLGVAGGLAGTAAGIGLAYLLLSYFAESFVGVHARFSVSAPMVIATLIAGPALAVAASVPGLRRALRRPIAEVLANRGASGFGDGRLDRLIARSHLLPGPARMGIRNVLRQKRRSASTIAQVTVAVALALALFAVGRTAAVVIDSIFGAYHFSIEVDAYNGAPLLTKDAQAVAAATPGVASVEPLVENGVQYQGSSYPAYGLGTTTLYRYQLRAGRWFTTADTTAAIPPVVLGPAIARTTHATIGSVLTLGTPAGTTRVRVVGLDAGQLDNGTIVFLPLAVLQRLAGMSGATNAVWLTTTSQSHPFIDQVSTAVVNRLGAAGFPVQVEEKYVAAQQNQTQISAILIVLQVLGVLVVAISLIGLISTLTMGIIERTREVGILRCLGARARQVRRVFSAEAVVITTVGWLFGVGFGYLMFLGLLDFVRHLVGVETPAVFPLSAIPVALVLMVLVTLVVIRLPLRRAARIAPSDALRYE